MFSRAVQDYKVSFQQHKLSHRPLAASVQKTLDFNLGARRKAFDVIEDTNKPVVVDRVMSEKTSALIAAATKADAFEETKGQIIIDGEVFDEADFFDDIMIDDTDHSFSRPAVQTQVKAEGTSSKDPIVLDSDGEYFKDSDDMDWNTSLGPIDVETARNQSTTHSSPPDNVIPENTQPILPMPTDVIQDKENAPPRTPAESDHNLAKLLFPSSQPLLWSPSPEVERKQPLKRTLPWVVNPSRHESPKPTQPVFQSQKSKVKSIVHESSRSISTMTTVETVSGDWSILGITEKELFELKRRERLEELQRKSDDARRGMEWIDQPAPTKAARRRKRTEEKPQAEAKRQSKIQSVAKIFLSQEQVSVRKLVVEDKRSVFFTGSAGTGKSVLLREIIDALKKRYVNNPDVLAVTASTGLAACNVGGITLHSFAGIGLGREGTADLAKKIRKNRKGFDRWRRTKVLIIDEISMVDGHLFDKLEELARILRTSDQPFGGIQLVITGDFFQLPPVSDGPRGTKFAFEAESWSRCIQHTIKLTNVFRQKDQEFVEMLNEMRMGTLSKTSIQKFKELQRTPQFDDNIEPTELFPTRQEVDQANNARMRSLPGSTHSFTAEEGGAITNPQQRNKLLQNCLAPQVLELKKDAQVMLIKNLDDNLVNGSLGKVIGFMSDSTYALCEAQGIGLESALNFNTRSDDPFGFNSPDPEDQDSESVLRKKRRTLKLGDMAASTSQLWPLVRFTIANGLHIDRLMTKEKWQFENPDGEVQAYRRQVPLVLAYAISIHKAQGQTLSRVRVDLNRVFEKGQAYVALSRATSREGLQILRFDPRKVMAHPKVAGFYRSLDNVERVMSKNEAELAEEERIIEQLQEREHEEFVEYAYG